MNDNMNYNNNNMNNMNYNMNNNNEDNNVDAIKKANKVGKKIIALLTTAAILIIIVTLFLIWTTLFVEDNRSEELITNIRSIMDGAKDMVQIEGNDFTDETVTYYVSNKCITGKENVNSPYGEFDPAYVVIAYEEEKYNYYFIGRDAKGYGFKEWTRLENITEDNLKSDLVKDEIVTDKGYGDRTKVVIIDSKCERKEGTSYKVYVDKIEKNDFDDKQAIKIYAYREIDPQYTVTKVGILYAANSGLGFFTNDSVDLTKNEAYDVEDIIKNNKTGNVSEVVAQNPTNKGEYALIYTIVKENDMVYAIPYVEATDNNGKEYKFYGELVATSYEQAK